MKVFSKIFLFALVLVCAFFLLQKETFAQSIQCSAFDVDPKERDQNGIFTFTANCNVQNTSIILYIEDSTGNQTSLTERNAQISSSGELNHQISVDDSIEEGSYNAYLLDPNQNLITGPIVFGVSSAVTPKTCCRITARDQSLLCQEDTLESIIANEPNCVVPATGADPCPDFCQAISIRTTCSTNSQGELRICAGVSSDHPSLCESGSFNEVGINSAIGCIPIEDTSSTTAFFVRWALGVGGGIALFLIALSGIKIATTKGDPKRLQDARDTFSAAIAGLVLIVLSVFLMRFISESLLNLF